ncbi:hypothetical protein TRFO_06838 [Tritrichomonas foetus]|uniref:Protein kinase domain-containing protein n=1 Tax=Tritrichomonas foetus TaxID=1144522 RepID=A0A1J4JVX6_9EUKA|nr:hypothetical protein TRFO_06838 [Tritrichomonas foetus]|eukprot:OHT03163.1 hypothetical protein TRFO_06838 [Tritrichomonas foetus]
MDHEQTRKILLEHGYELISKVGEGAYSHVFLVNSVKYQVDFIIKQVDQTKFPAITKEIDILRQLHHPNIIGIYEYFEVDDFLYIILENCPGGSLKDVTSRAPLKINLFFTYAFQIISALEYCHSKGIVHRDIKPANILIDKYGRPKIADFGIASADVVNTQKIGSPLFLAPEVIENDSYDGMKSDIWALGITFYFLLFKKFPWKHNCSIEEQVRQQKTDNVCFPPNTKISIRNLISMMLRLAPKDRPSASDLLKLDIFRKELQTNQSAMSRRKSMVTTMGIHKSFSQQSETLQAVTMRVISPPTSPHSISPPNAAGRKSMMGPLSPHPQTESFQDSPNALNVPQIPPQQKPLNFQIGQLAQRLYNLPKAENSPPQLGRRSLQFPSNHFNQMPTMSKLITPKSPISIQKNWPPQNFGQNCASDDCEAFPNIQNNVEVSPVVNNPNSPNHAKPRTFSPPQYLHPSGIPQQLSLDNFPMLTHYASFSPINSSRIIQKNENCLSFKLPNLNAKAGRNSRMLYPKFNSSRNLEDA